MFCRVVLLLAVVNVTLAQYSQRVYHHFDLARAPEIKRAKCIMRLNMNGTEIGTVELKSDGTLQQLDVFMESTEITEGEHGLRVHDGRVRDYDCATARGNFNPNHKNGGSPLSFTDKRRIGNFGNVIASSTGRIHWESKFVVKENAADLKNHGTIRMEPLLKLQKRGGTRQKKGKKGKEGRKKSKDKKTQGKRKDRKGKKEKPEPVAPEPAEPEEEKEEKEEQEIKHVIQVKQPKYKYYATYYVDKPRFALEGLDSIIGRAVVLHAGKEDLGTGNDDGSKATENAGSRVACCTLVAA